MYPAGQGLGLVLHDTFPTDISGSDDLGVPEAAYGIELGVDMVDWEAVRAADPAELCDAIRCRGMYYMLTGGCTVHYLQTDGVKTDGVAWLWLSHTPQVLVLAALADGLAVLLTYSLTADRILKFLNKISTEGEGGQRLEVPGVTESGTATVATAAAVAGEVAAATPAPEPLLLLREEPAADRGSFLAAADPAPEPVAHPGPSSNYGAGGDTELPPPGGDTDAAQQLTSPSSQAEPVLPAVRRMSLEWLRSVSEEQAASYLMNVAGLGRKSTG